VTDAAVRLSQIHRLVDFAALAALALPAPAYGYVAGGAWDEETLADNEAGIRRSMSPRLVVETLLLRWAMMDRIAVPNFLAAST